MPANPKYLTSSNWQKSIKIITGLIGGYIISALIHMILALVLPFHKEVLITSIFTHFILWGALVIIPYVFKNAYRALGVYVLTIIILFIVYTKVNQFNLFV